MENQQDNDTDDLLVIDVFVDPENSCNEEYFLNEPADEPVSIADIYFSDEILSDVFPKTTKPCEMVENLPYQPESNAPLVQMPEFIIIDNVNSNSRILIDSNSCNKVLATDKSMINLNKLNGNNRSVLRKILPKPNSIYENSNHKIVTAIITYKCVVCSLLFADYKDFQAHLKEHYFTCEECPENFPDQNELLNHLRFTHSYSIIKRPEENVEKIEILKVFPSSLMIENFEMGNAFEDIENLYVVEDQSEVNYLSNCDDSYITLEEAKELQMKMEEEANMKKNVRKLRNM